MLYSKDLRISVLDYVSSGGSKAEAARIFGITRQTVHNWIRLGDDVSSKKPGPKGPHKLDPEALAFLISKSPDKTLCTLGSELGVHYSSVHYALKKLNYSRKKNVEI